MPSMRRKKILQDFKTNCHLIRDTIWLLNENHFKNNMCKTYKIKTNIKTLNNFDLVAKIMRHNRSSDDSILFLFFCATFPLCVIK